MKRTILFLCLAALLIGQTTLGAVTQMSRLNWAEIAVIFIKLHSHRSSFVFCTPFILYFAP